MCSFFSRFCDLEKNGQTGLVEVAGRVEKWKKRIWSAEFGIWNAAGTRGAAFADRACCVTPCPPFLRRGDVTEPFAGCLSSCPGSPCLLLSLSRCLEFLLPGIELSPSGCFFHCGSCLRPSAGSERDVASGASGERHRVSSVLPDVLQGGSSSHERTVSQRKPLSVLVRRFPGARLSGRATAHRFSGSR